MFRGSLKRKTEVLRPLLFKISSSGHPPPLGQCQPASLHAARSQRPAAKSSEQNIYRKGVSIHHLTSCSFKSAQKLSEILGCLKSGLEAEHCWGCWTLTCVRTSPTGIWNSCRTGHRNIHQQRQRPIDPAPGHGAAFNACSKSLLPLHRPHGKANLHPGNP